MKAFLPIFALIWALFMTPSTPLAAQSTALSVKKPYSFTHKKLPQVTPIEKPLAKGTTKDVSNDVYYNMDNSGQWDDLPNGDRLWRFRIHAENATGISFFMTNCQIPDGAYLFAYNREKKWVVGPVTKPNYAAFRPDELDNMRIGHVLGNDISLEYYEPAQHKGKSKLEIREILRCVGMFPYSMTHKLKGKPGITISPTTIDTFLIHEKEIKRNFPDPAIPAIGWWSGLTPYNSGTWEELPNGDRVWRLEITAPTLKERINHLEFDFDAPFLPPGSQLYYYSPDKTHISRNLVLDKWGYGNGYAPGNTIIIEYYEPKGYKGKTSFKIKAVFHYFFMAEMPEKALYCGSEGGENCTPEVRCSCEYGIDASCIPNNICSSIITEALIDTLRRATVRIQLFSPSLQPYSNCTGTLIRNALNEPLVLTANHCFRADGGIWHYAVGDSVRWRFHFNDESKRDSTTNMCSLSLGNRDVTTVVIGGYVLAASGVTASNASARSDFALIKLNSYPSTTSFYAPYYAGWSAQKSLTNVSAGLGIHHPGGTSKKVSIEDSALNLGCPQNNGVKPYQYPTGFSQYFQKDIIANNLGDHFAVTFERGINRPGSSGHAFLDQNGLVRGQFHGSSNQLCCATTDQDAFQHEEGGTPNMGGNANYLDQNCNAVVGTSPNKKYLNGNTERYSEYGRLWYSWSIGAYDVDNVGGISQQDSIKSTLEHWLDPYQSAPDTIMAGLNVTDCEIYMKDCLADTGTEPSTCTAPLGTTIVASPDLWNNTINMLDPLDVMNTTHEMPDFKDPQGNHLDNYICFRVRNASSTCTSAPATLHLYWAMASTGLQWPQSWHNHDVGIGSSTCIVGNEIGTNCYANDIQPYQIPSLAPGGTHTNSLCWLPPNFTDPNADPLYYPYQNPGSCANLQATTNYGGLHPRFAISLLARVVSLDNPIRNEQQGSIMNNVRNSNNIAIRNTFLADIGGPPRVILVGGSGFSDVVIKEVRSLIEGGDAESLAGLLNVELLPGAELWDKWASTGFKGEGIEIVSDGVIKITNFEIAKLLDIPFDENKSEPLAIRVTIINSSGKVPDQNLIPNQYIFSISHEKRNPTGNEPESSPCIFEVNDIRKHISVNNIPEDFAKLHIQPNPFVSETSILFDTQKDGKISLHVYDLQGKLISTIYNNQYLAAGNYSYVLSTEHLVSGLYFVVLQTEYGSKREKMIKLK